MYVTCKENWLLSGWSKYCCHMWYRIDLKKGLLLAFQGEEWLPPAFIFGKKVNGLFFSRTGRRQEVGKLALFIRSSFLCWQEYKGYFCEWETRSQVITWFFSRRAKVILKTVFIQCWTREMLQTWGPEFFA